MKLPNPFSLREIEHPLFGRRPVAVSTLWRVFTVNALVFGAAVFVLILSPATVRNHIRFTELVVLVVGLVATLAVDLVLLALVLAPLRRLATLMGNIDPRRPGQRAPAGNWASSETIALSQALNTMLDRIETERRESARRALAAQEGERLRVARELHDELGQTLTAVALQAERVAADFPSQTAPLQEIVATVHHSLDDVRRIVRELRPEALDDLGLTDALISLCLRMEQQGALTVRRELEGGLPPFSSEVELVIYRVAQEALTNALRHSRATEVRVALGRGEEDTVVLRVTDDGEGLLSAPIRQTGGLPGMRERAILIEADLEVANAPGKGVEVRLAVASNHESA
ncbi:MAG TPA: sensor histidine kinase [Solirubrobacteraceae bacterium]|jgi:two-component system sensor histidine kinase UhpB